MTMTDDLDDAAERVRAARGQLIWFGATVRRTREQREVSLRELGRELELHYSVVQKIEAGKICPTEEQLEILLDWVLETPSDGEEG